MLFFLLNLSVYCGLVISDSTVEYYKKLIEYETTRASTYALPTENVDFKKAYESDQQAEEFGTYDFVIVGAGTAGSVVATRLSEISDFKILLIEAGGEENDFSKIPEMSFYSQFNEFNWGYYTSPQKFCCLEMIDQKCMVPRGKAIGGTSTLNGLVYMRGTEADFDNWAKQGNPGWSFKDVLPYFKKSQNSQIRSKPDFQGLNGFWNVEYIASRSNLSDIFFKANKELGISYIDDYNELIQLGTSKVQTNIKHGQRQSTGTAFLEKSRRRNNLKVITNALATKIIIEKNVAKGIEFVTNTKKYKTFAKKEVILSAGVFNTPQLLMLSGIGPKKDLERLKISLIKDLPVGKQLFSHPVFQGLVFNSNYIRKAETIKQKIQEYLKGEGSLADPYNFQAINFIRTNSRVPKNEATVENILILVNSVNKKISSRIHNHNKKFRNFLNQANPNAAFAFYLQLLQPKSKGYITLKTNSPIDFPIIDANSLSEQEDLDVIIEAIEQNLKLIQTKPFQKINATLLDYNICKNFEQFSKPFWECIVRHYSTTASHYCGTTPMGPSISNNSVVDADLLVYGIKQLRVIDAGVFPTLISAHTSAPTVMVAEKASDSIKKKYGIL